MMDISAMGPKELNRFVNLKCYVQTGLSQLFALHMQAALKVLNGYVWKKKTLTAKVRVKTQTTSTSRSGCPHGLQPLPPQGINGCSHRLQPLPPQGTKGCSHRLQPLPGHSHRLQSFLPQGINGCSPRLQPLSPQVFVALIDSSLKEWSLS